MADSKDVVDANVFSPEFITDLLLSAQRMALVYNLSYLYVGGFPKLEHLLKERALETQLLFGSSEAVLMKCVGTSENLVKSLLPFLKVAVENNSPQLILDVLEKAKGWISYIINDVKETVARYDKHKSDVAKSTSDIVTEKKETEMKQQQQTSEMKALQKIMDDLDANLQTTNKELEDIEKKIAEIQKFINGITGTKDQKTPAVENGAGSGLALFSAIVPFVGSIIGFISKMVLSSSQESSINTLQTGLSELTSAQQRLKERKWEIQNKLMDNQLQLKLAKLKIENGQMPSVTHLDEVQKCLYLIQKILNQLQKFWEKVGFLLDTLKKETFAGEDYIECLADLKEEFLEFIDKDKEGWTQFGSSCMKANTIFSIQSSQAYKFLEISPSSLSKEEWQKEYENVKEKLEKIRPNTVNVAIKQ